MARRTVLTMIGFAMGWCVAMVLLLTMTGCAHAGQIHTLAGSAATSDVDSSDCTVPILIPAGTQSVMRWLYRQNKSLVKYDSLGAVAPGAQWTMPALWLPSGRYYEVVANRDSGGVTPCPIVRWFTIRGAPLPPTLDALAPGER